MQNDRQPLYMQIKDHFKQLISSGTLSVDDRLPAEKDLIKQFNVSRITVANALAQLAKEGWIYRIPGRGSFVNKEALQLIQKQNKPSTYDDNSKTHLAASTSQRKMIGFLIPNITDFFAIRLLQGIQQVLDGTDYYLAIQFTHNRKHLEKEALLDFIQKGAVGLIIFPVDAENYNEEILALKLKHFPFVLVDRYFPGVETDYVSSDGALGVKLAIDHLWDLGHRKIAICSDSPMPTLTVEDRLAGYMDSMKQKGALIDPALMLTEFNVNYNSNDEEQPLYRYIKNGMATAFITLNARLGLHIASIARKLNIRVPEDLSIVTFDDPSPDFDELGTFSFVSQGEEEMGKTAAKTLLDSLKNTTASQHSYQKIILKPELVLRQSTGSLYGEASEGNTPN